MSINPEMLKQLLEEFNEKEALNAAEINVVEQQILEMEQKIIDVKVKLELVAADRNKVELMKARHMSGDWTLPPEVLAAVPVSATQNSVSSTSQALAALTKGGQPAAAQTPSPPVNPAPAPGPAAAPAPAPAAAPDQAPAPAVVPAPAVAPTLAPDAAVPQSAGVFSTPSANPTNALFSSPPPGTPTASGSFPPVAATASGTFQPVASAETAPQPAPAPAPTASGTFPAPSQSPFPPPPALQADTTANPFATATPAVAPPAAAPQAVAPPAAPQTVAPQDSAPGFETALGTPAADQTAAPVAEGEEDEETVRDINDALRGLFR